MGCFRPKATNGGVTASVDYTQSNATIAGLDLDALARRPSRHGAEPTLRWIIVHMIEETARHAGHLDILRELLDGEKAYF